MRRFRASARALSEIVGTLMLVLIVVVAATAFAAFVQAYQKQAQSEQAFSNEQHLESLRILNVIPTVNATNPSAWESLNFTLASEYINSATITSVAVNSNPLAQYQVLRVDPSTGLYSLSWVRGNATSAQLILAPREQVNLIVNLSKSPTTGSFYGLNFTLPTTSYIQLSLFTALQNKFNGLFLPPTALAIISTIVTFYNGTLQTVPVLDGSHSFQTGNASIVGWMWKVYEGFAPHAQFAPTGEQVVAPSYFPGPPGSHYNVTLNVTNNDGLTSTASIPYISP
ncbi:MAG: hypothetical protein L3K23_08410 [Thermoplasmata archaeon]|nr:hypothetical protein [Thermoplasmata archaeon]